MGPAQHSDEARPVIAASRSLDQMPSQPVANSPEAECMQLLVIRGGREVVARCRDQVEAIVALAQMRRTFEPAHEEAGERIGRNIGCVRLIDVMRSIGGVHARMALTLPSDGGWRSNAAFP